MDSFDVDRVVNAIEENTRAQAETARAINNLVRLVSEDLYHSRPEAYTGNYVRMLNDADDTSSRIEKWFGIKAPAINEQQ